VLFLFTKPVSYVTLNFFEAGVMSVTIRKIAKDLQLAVSTVSKALRDSHEISEETKRRVFEYAEKMDYVPNPYASSLKGRKSGNIAVVLPEVADSFFSIAINGIESVARAKGYHVMVYLTHEDQEREKFILRDFRSGRVDGILISVSRGTNNRSYIQDLCEKDIPLVFFDRVCDEIEAAKVITDDYESAYNATLHLIQKKCREIAFLSLSENLSIVNQRLKGYQQALVDNNIKLKKNNIVNVSNEEEKDYLILRNLLKRKNKPDGVVCSVEKLATLCYEVCHGLHLRIPNDVRVIAFSNLQIASLLNPSLTTITQPAFEMGKTAASLLFKVLEKKKINLSGERIIIPSVLLGRDSTQ
jgi:LacI family transcriptional regulator